MAKHTLGPWKIEKEEDSLLIKDHSADEFFIARVPKHWVNSKGNASLIAAAPDLLEACTAWVNHIDSDGVSGTFEDERRMMAAMRSAIKKAKGGK